MNYICGAPCGGRIFSRGLLNNNEVNFAIFLFTAVFKPGRGVLT